jgi:sugar-specific transcriptional regulator TrmB
MDNFEVFSRAGLNKKSAAVFAALIDKGVLSISQLSRETHLNRPALYELLPQMRHAGFVSQVQKQKRIFYKAESPSRLLEAYTEDHQDIARRLAEIAQQYAEGSREKPVIKYFEGLRGVTFVFDDVARTLPKGGLFFRYSSRTGDAKELQSNHYIKTRDEKGIERMVITSEEKAKNKTKKLDRSVKAIPKDFDLFADNVSLLIYGDKTAYIDYGSKTAFIVESPKIARFQEKLFRLLYKKL